MEVRPTAEGPGVTRLPLRPPLSLSTHGGSAPSGTPGHMVQNKMRHVTFPVLGASLR